MNDEFYCISRILDTVAILEFPDGNFREVNLELLPTNIEEGNILKKGHNGQFVIDYNEEERRKKEMLNLQDDIFG